MSERHAFVDRGAGETRGVVTLDGRPERLLIRRDEDDLRLMLGARVIARVDSLEPALATAFLDLGEGLGAILSFKPEAKPVRGSLLEIEIRSEPRRGKLAVARAVGPGEGVPRLLSDPPDLAEVLQGLTRDTELSEGRAARDVADEAEAEALETIHALAGGGSISIEPTRALTAIDVDLGERKGPDSKRITRQVNVATFGAAARLLRLKSLGGLVVFDLAGRGHDGVALMAAARAAFAPDNPGVAIGPIGRFGTMELSLPRRTAPIFERLCRADGALSDRTLAQRLIRRLEAEAEARPGARLAAVCAPDVAAAARPLEKALAGRIGARFTVSADTALRRDRMEVDEA